MSKMISIRLGTEGKATIMRDFEEIATSGEGAARRAARAAIKAEEEKIAAIKRSDAAYQKAYAVLPKNTFTPDNLERFAGNRSDVGKSAADSASIFGAAYAKMEERTKALMLAIDPVARAQDRFNREIGNARELVSAGVMSLDQYTQKLVYEKAALDAVSGSTERLEDRVRAFRASIDPTIAAQDRFNSQMGEARTLISAGAISLDEYCDKLRIEKRELDAVEQAHRRTGTASRAHTFAVQNLGFQIQDFAVQVGGGQSAMLAFAQQLPQATGALSGMGGKAAAIGAFFQSGWGIALTVAIAALGPLTAKLFENEEASKRAEEGARKFADRQSDIKNFINEATGALKEQNRTLVLNAILTRQKRIDDNEESIRDGRKKALAAVEGARTGRQQTTVSPTTGAPIAMRGTDPDLREALKSAGGDVDKLAQSIAQLARTTRPDLKDLALDISSIGGQAITAQRDNIALGKELRALNGDTTAMVKADAALIDSRAKLAGATTALDRAQAQYAVRKHEIEAAWDASDKGAAAQARRLKDMTAAEHALNVAQDANKKGGAARAATLARQADAMEVNASAALDLAKAYLVGGDAALKAEAARKGLTDATRKGIDGEAQVRRQLAIMVGDEVVAGAKSVAKLREETDARVAVRKAIQDGIWTWDQASDALAEEAALRPLLKLQTVAQGDALKALTTVIDQYRAALRRARDEEALDNGSRASSAAQDRAQELQLQIAELPLAEAERRRNADIRAAGLEADRLKLSGDARKDFLRNKRSESEAGIEFDRARFASDMLTSQKDGLALAAEELRLAAANDNVREQSLSRLRLILDLKRAGVDLDSAEGVAILANADAYDVLMRKLREQQAAWAEMTDFGAQFVDTVLSPDTWEDWGEGGKAVIAMVRNELLKLALINPIKNMLLGENNVTLGSLLKSFTGMFGGGGAGDGAGGSQGFVGPPGDAVGTHYSPGGDRVVGEFGREIVRMPRGASVVPAGETRRLLASNDSGPPRVSNYFDLRGAVVTEQLYADMQGMAADAATAGAMGGAQMAETEGFERSARQLGRKW